MKFHELTGLSGLNVDLKLKRNSSSQVNGGCSSGEELWNLGPTGRDVILFWLLFLTAEDADNWDSDDVSGEKYHGDLSDPVYLSQMRDTLLPLLISYSTAQIDNIEHFVVENDIDLPIILQYP